MITPDALGYSPETPSQTAGPFVHIGLIPRQAGFDILENNLGSITLGARGRILKRAHGLSTPSSRGAWRVGMGRADLRRIS